MINRDKKQTSMEADCCHPLVALVCSMICTEKIKKKEKKNITVKKEAALLTIIYTFCSADRKSVV